MATKDKRYSLIRPLVAQGEIVIFNDIFKVIPKTVVAKSIGKKVDRFTELMIRIEDFTVRELLLIGNLCELTEFEIITLVLNEHIQNKNKVIRTAKSEVP
jgi:hypothetical protein